MNAIITLLASIVIGLFFIGPYLAARFAIELLIVKQPAKAQTSTEELARSLFFSVPFVAVASFLVWLRFHTHYVFDPATLDVVFASGITFEKRWPAMQAMWPVRSVLLVVYVEVAIFVSLVWLAVHLLRITKTSTRRLSWNYVYRKLASPYLKSEWDVLANQLLLPRGTVVQADVATKGGKVFLGTLEGVVTNSDGTLRHMELSSPTIRAVRPEASAEQSETPVLQDYVFRNSFYFVVLASEISNVNLRFAESGGLLAAEGGKHETGDPVEGRTAPRGRVRRLGSGRTTATA